MTMTDDERKTAEEYADELRERVGDRYFKDSKVQMLLGEAVRNYSEAEGLTAEVRRLREVLEEIAEGAVDDPQSDTALELMRMAREALEGEG